MLPASWGISKVGTILLKGMNFSRLSLFADWVRASFKGRMGKDFLSLDCYQFAGQKTPHSGFHPRKPALCFSPPWISACPAFHRRKFKRKYHPVTAHKEESAGCNCCGVILPELYQRCPFLPSVSTLATMVILVTNECHNSLSVSR